MTGFSKDSFPHNPKLIFMGTPEFALPTLEALIHHDHEILAVVTQPDRPKGRGRKVAAPPVKELALKHSLEVLQPQKASDDDFCELIKRKEPDLIIVVAFGQILKIDFLNIPRWGVINIHASLLPKYRGAAPIPWVILNNESQTGLTVMHMDEGMDTGPILFQVEIPILQDETYGQLHDRLAREAGDLIITSLNGMAGNSLKGIPQDHSMATYAPKIEKSTALIDWKQHAPKISSLIRAHDPIPGAYTTIEGKVVKLFSSRVVDEDRLDVVPGKVIRDEGGGLCVETGQGVIEVREIQYTGKKRLSVPDFLRGFSLTEGTVLGN
jgi:methionyl-tRNA formyltransferase